MSHYKQQCKMCDKITAQCRCPSKDKAISFVVCDDCLKKLDTVELPQEEKLNQDK